MRRLPWLGLLVLVGACHSSSKGDAPEAGPGWTLGPAASASARAGPVMLQASASGGTTVALPPGRVMGRCDGVKDAAVCSPDGTAEMSCANGRWMTVQLCDGPKGCTGRGDDLACDQKKVKAGDPCPPNVSLPRCNDPKTLMRCMSGKWVQTVCALPGKCRPQTLDSPAVCQ